MISYTKAAMERAMKVQEVILPTIAKRITWRQPAEIIGISERQMRRWGERYEEFGLRGLFDRRRASPRRNGGADRSRAQARTASQAATATAFLRHAAAHRWQRASLVSRRALV